MSARAKPCGRAAIALTQGGTQIVDAFSRTDAPLVVTAQGREFAITHMATGMKIASSRYVGKARAIVARLLSSSAVDWKSRLDLAGPEERRAAYQATIEACDGARNVGDQP